MTLTQFSDFKTLVAGFTRDHSHLTPSLIQESDQTKITSDQGCSDTSDKGLDERARVCGTVMDIKYRAAKTVIFTRHFRPD